MKIIDKVSGSVSQSVDYIIDKNRQAAQLNRLKAIIKTENDTLNNAYIELGKYYFEELEGNAPKDADIDALRETVKKTSLKLKKARARYEYIQKYGVPKSEEDGKCSRASCAKNADDDEDITIAYSGAADEKKEDEKEEKPSEE